MPTKDTKRWTAEQREEQRRKLTENNPTALGVAARKAKRRCFSTDALAQALSHFASSGLEPEST